MDNSNWCADILRNVEQNLDKGENIVWAGQSKMRSFRMNPMRCIADIVGLTSLILAIALLCWTYIELGIATDFILYVFICLVLALFANIIWFVYRRGIPKRRAICFVTDKRAAHFAPRKGKKDKVRIYPLSNIRRIKTNIFPDGWGNIRFTLKTYDRVGTLFTAPIVSWGWAESGFFDVEDAETATHHLSELTGIEPTPCDGS